MATQTGQGTASSDWYDKAFQEVLIDEGIVTEKVTGDAGGRTTLGIAHAFWPKDEAAAYDLLVNKKDVEGAKAYAKAFYKKNFWDYMQVEKLPSYELAKTAFNIGVNQGSDRIRNYIAQSGGDAHKFTVLIAQRYNYIAKQTVAGVPQKKFYNGWMNRLNRQRADLKLPPLAYTKDNPFVDNFVV